MYVCVSGAIPALGKHIAKCLSKTLGGNEPVCSWQFHSKSQHPVSHFFFKYSKEASLYYGLMACKVAFCKMKPFKAS